MAEKKPSKATAAMAEVEPQEKSFKWQGLTLTLPAELPEVVLFDVVEMEASENGIAILRTLRSILGPDQFTQVRNKLGQLGANAESEVLFDGIFGQYGLGSGESSASDDS